MEMQMPTMIPKRINVSNIMKHIDHDKKKLAGVNRFILINKIGSAFIHKNLNNKYLSDLSKNFIS